MPVATRRADVVAPPKAEALYAECLRQLKRSRIPFLVAGTFAVSAYTGINRPTKDLDIFCKAGDFPRILLHFKEHGFETAIEDERWLAKVRVGKCFFDVIFSSPSAVITVSDHWFMESHPAEIYGVSVQLTPPTEMIWSKALLQNRHRYDGADIAHLILRQNDRIDWKRLLTHMEQYWEVLLIHVLNFRFIYPSERDMIPRWLIDELLLRAKEQADLPVPNLATQPLIAQHVARDAKQFRGLCFRISQAAVVAESRCPLGQDGFNDGLQVVAAEGDLHSGTTNKKRRRLNPR